MSSPVVPGLIDTAVMVGWVRGQPDAAAFLLAANRRGRPQLSQLTAMEMTVACRDQPERANVRQFLAACRVHTITAPIAHRALAILERPPPPSPLTADDATVAATAVVHKLPLYTLDPGRFAAVPGLTVLRPY